MLGADSMQEPAGTMRSQDSDDAPASVAAASNDRAKPHRFAYANGDQPLDGYTIKRGIGTGGFGDVYYALSDAGKEVALKRIQRNLDVELRGVKQCLNLKHPNLLALFDVRFDEHHQAWVVMEYVSGESLQQVIDRNPSGMPLEQVSHWFGGIAEGIAYLHDHGIVHRDLKPGNIFSDQGIVKIGDYGLSKFISCSRRSGQTESVGTFHYMAPEIGLGRYGKEIDVYALGIILFEMVTGRVPFEGESSQEIIMKHLTATPDVSRLPESLQPIVAQAMHKEPERRFRSVGEMLLQVRQALGTAASAVGPGVSVSPPPVSSAGEHEPADGASDTPDEPIMADVVELYEVDDLPDEPIARAICQAWRAFQSQHDRARRRDSSGHTLLILVSAVLLFFFAGYIIPALFMLAVPYAIYYVIWWLAVGSDRARQAQRRHRRPAGHRARFSDSDVAYAPTQVIGSREATVETEYRRREARRRHTVRPVGRKQVLDSLASELRHKTVHQHLTELTRSMLMAALVAAVLGVLFVPVGAGNLDVTLYGWGPLYAWLVITSTVGSWFVLAFSKSWEGRRGDQALRRFFLLVAGLLTGAMAGWLAKQLLLEPTYLLGNWNRFPQPLADRLPLLYEVTGSPRILAYVAYFAALMVICRWWRRTDPLRAARVGLWSTGIVIVVAMLLYSVIPIPRGFMVATIMAVAVQLSAPWISPEEREQAKNRLEAAAVGR